MIPKVCSRPLTLDVTIHDSRDTLTIEVCIFGFEQLATQNEAKRTVVSSLKDELGSSMSTTVPVMKRPSGWGLRHQISFLEAYHKVPALADLEIGIALTEIFETSAKGFAKEATTTFATISHISCQSST